MNDYLEKLGRALGRMSAGEREEILADFREHFLAAHAAGKTDAQIAAGLGDPQQVGRMYRAEHAVEGAQRAGGLKSVLRMLGAVARYKLLGGLLIALPVFCDALHGACTVRVRIRHIVCGFGVPGVRRAGARKGDTRPMRSLAGS